jgi:hypothetical protein
MPKDEKPTMLVALPPVNPSTCSAQRCKAVGALGVSLFSAIR